MPSSSTGACSHLSMSPANRSTHGFTSGARAGGLAPCTHIRRSRNRVQKGEQTGTPRPQNALGCRKPVAWCCPSCTLLIPPLPAQLLCFLHTKHSRIFHQPLRLQINHLRFKLRLDLHPMKSLCCTRMLTHPLSMCMWLLSNLLPAAFCLICLLTGWFIFFGDGFWIGNPGWPQTCSNSASGSWMLELQVLSPP